MALNSSGRIIGSDKDYIYLEVAEKDILWLKSHIDQKQLFDINFKINSLPYKIQHKALELAEKFDLHSILINNRRYNSYDELPEEFESSMEHPFSGKSAESLNEEQKMAVKYIAKMSNSLPYLIFGPAGTGKTRTLVAAIEEIVRSTNKCILVCACSNAACDEITQRLLQKLKTNEIFRMYAKSYNTAKIIKTCSNFIQGEFRFPSLKFLYKFRVVICTLLTAGNLVRARSDPDFDTKHFSHVFIDECASTNETTTLIPIAGKCSVHFCLIKSLSFLIGISLKLLYFTFDRLMY